MEYTVVSARTPKELVQLVTALIAKGWAPLGGLACSVDYYLLETYCQAMAKAEAEPKA